MTVPPKYAKHIALLSKMELFQGLNPEEMLKIFSKGITERMKTGETLFYKGSTGSQMYVILSGRVRIYDEAKELATLGPGDSFGEMAMLNDEPRSATAVVAQDAYLLVFTETTFQRLLTKRVAVRILLNIVKTLSHRLTKANAALKDK